MRTDLDEKLRLFSAIKEVTAEMARAARGETAPEALASLIARRQELMDRVDACPDGGHAEEIKQLLREILEMDEDVKKSLVSQRDEARRALEKVQASKKGLAYLKQAGQAGSGRFLSGKG